MIGPQLDWVAGLVRNQIAATDLDLAPAGRPDLRQRGCPAEQRERRRASPPHRPVDLHLIQPLQDGGEPLIDTWTSC